MFASEETLLLTNSVRSVSSQSTGRSNQSFSKTSSGRGEETSEQKEKGKRKQKEEERKEKILSSLSINAYISICIVQGCCVSAQVGSFLGERGV